MASERRTGQTRLEAELAAALGALEGARGGEGVSRGITERLRAEAAEASARWVRRVCVVVSGEGAAGDGWVGFGGVGRSCC